MTSSLKYLVRCSSCSWLRTPPSSLTKRSFLLKMRFARPIKTTRVAVSLPYRRESYPG